MRILITGGAGFIGSHSAETLIAQGHEVRVLDDLTSGSFENMSGLRANAELLIGDILDPVMLDRAAKGADAILHLAAVVSVSESIRDPLRAHAINASGTLHVLEAARRHGIGRVVIASSAAVYGGADEPPLTEAVPTQARSPYAAQKAMAESYARLYAELHGLSPICLRYFNVFGPRQNPASPYSGVLSRFAAAALAGEPVTIFGDGAQTRDFVFVRDVAQANALALTAPAACAGRAYNIGTGRSLSLLAAHQQLGRLFEAPLPPPRFEPARPGDIRHSQAEIAAARRDLGYRPLAAFEEGLRDTLSWLRVSHSRVGTSVYLT